MGDICLGDLPPEILLEVAKKLSFSDRLNFGSTRRKFRKLLAPLIFRAIRLESECRSVHAVLSLLRQYGEHITDLHLSLWAPGELRIVDESTTLDTSQKEENVKLLNRNIESDSQFGKHQLLPDLTTRILKGETITLTAFGREETISMPNLSGVKVRFDFQLDDSAYRWEETDIDLGGIYTFNEAEDLATVQYKEQRFEWRALMAHTWAALSQNTQIKRLEVDRLIPKPTSTFFTTEWVHFLHRLEALDISMWGGENGAGWHASTQDAYLDFEGHLGDYFFQHLRDNAKYLRFAADLHTPTGNKPQATEYMRYTTIGLKAPYVPGLETLMLENVYVDRDLISLVIHCSRIQTISLHNCHAVLHGDSDLADPLTWADFFTAIREGNSNLKQLAITEDEPVPLVYRFHDGSNPEEDDADDVKYARQLLQNDRTRRLFSYGHLDDKYGDFMEDEEANVESFLRGEDQSAFNLLIEYINNHNKY